MRKARGKYTCPKCDDQVWGECVEGYMVCGRCGTKLQYVKTLQETKEMMHYRCDECLEITGTRNIKMGWTTCQKCHKGTLRPVHKPRF